jgi:hypothetical protein
MRNYGNLKVQFKKRVMPRRYLDRKELKLSRTMHLVYNYKYLKIYMKDLHYNETSMMMYPDNRDQILTKGAGYSQASTLQRLLDRTRTIIRIRLRSQ